MNKERTVDVLNSLIVINNDRIEGYKTASKETEENELNALFARFIATSEKCKQELISEVHKLGGEKAEGTKASGKFFRAWMDVKAALTGKDRKAILNSCEYGEDQAQETYQDAMKDNMEHLSQEHRTMIQAQKQALMEDHNHVKALRDALVDA